MNRIQRHDARLWRAVYLIFIIYNLTFSIGTATQAQAPDASRLFPDRPAVDTALCGPSTPGWRCNYHPWDLATCPEPGDTINNACVGIFEIEAHSAAAPNGRMPLVAWQNDVIGTFASTGSIQVIVRILNGCAVNGHHWVFIGGLTDQALELDVRIPVEGVAKHYQFSGGQPIGTVTDTEAFPCP